MTELIGWLGSILFALCGLPQAFSCYKEGSAKGLSWTFLLMWFFGEILTIIYIFPSKQYPLLFNYMCNLLSLLVILKYKINPRN